MHLDNVRLDKHTRYIPIIGCPMDQSSASYIYNDLFARHDINAIMWPLELEKGRLSEFMDARGVFSIDRFTLTMPHKADIIPLLDEVEEMSARFGSVNVIKTVNGRTYGVSCDGLGMMNALAGAGAPLLGKHVVMVGAGAISGIIGAELARKGVRQLTLLNRTLANAERVAGTLNDFTPIDARAEALTDAALARAAESADVLIQCSPLGMHGYGVDHESLDFLARLPKHAVAVEAIVNPPRTSFVRRAQALGLKTVLGMDMLVGQMRAIFSLWFDVSLTPDDEAAAKAILTARFAGK